MPRCKQFLSQHSGWRVSVWVNPIGLSSCDSHASYSPTESPATSPVCHHDSLQQLWLLPHTINSTNLDPVPSLTTGAPCAPDCTEGLFVPTLPSMPVDTERAHFMVSSHFSCKIQIKNNIITNFKKTIAKH